MSSRSLRMPAPIMFTPGRPNWWQWPTILSLDAPAVTLAWQALLVRVVFGAGPEARHVLLLGAGVWLSYAADRWIEGWRLTEATVRTPRHRFYLRWRWPVFAVWLLVLIGSVALAVLRLDAREWVFSLVLLAPALAYLLSHQFWHRHHPWRVPKELCVAGILTLGIVMYPLTVAHSFTEALRLAGPAGLFFLLALANCLLISEWEREVDVGHGQTSLPLRFEPARIFARRLPWAVLGVATVFALVNEGTLRGAGLCAAASAAMLAWLARMGPRLGWAKARVLADAALLTPLAFLLVWA